MEKGGSTRQRQVRHHQRWPAKEAIVKGRDIAADDKGHDAGVVELVAPAGDRLTVVDQGVESGAHTQARHGAGEEAGEDELIGTRRGLVARLDHAPEVERGNEGDERAEQVGPDVDGLVVKVEERAQRVTVRRPGAAVAAEDEGIVAAPGRQIVPEDEESRRAVGCPASRAAGGMVERGRRCLGRVAALPDLDNRRLCVGDGHGAHCVDERCPGG